MAPTIATVSPAAGRTGGLLLVTLTGTGFQVPFDPPLVGKCPPPPPPVRVRFGGVESPRVLVFSDTEVRALVPPGSAGTVDITLDNLDEDGATTGTVTATDAFTYTSPVLARTQANEVTLQRVVRQLLRELKGQVLANTSLTVHTDYDGSPETEVNVTEIGRLPAIVLSGPNISESKPLRITGNRYESDGSGGLYRLPETFTADLEFTLIALSELSQELLALTHEVIRYVHRTPYIYIDRDPTDPSAGRVRYEMAFAPGGTPRVSSASNKSNVRQALSTVVIRGVDIDEADGVAATNQVYYLVDAVTPEGVVPPPVPRPDIDITYTQKEDLQICESRMSLGLRLP